MGDPIGGRIGRNTTCTPRETQTLVSREADRMRRTALHLALICSALGLLPVLGAASAEAPPTLDRGAATQLLTMVNAERVARGLAPLVDDPALRGWAETWSLHMAGTGKLAHNDALFTRN